MGAPTNERNGASEEVDPSIRSQEGATRGERDGEGQGAPLVPSAELRTGKQAFKNINARAETVRRSPAFREAFASRRCVVPANGFFEWTGPKEDRRPIWFHRPDGGLILFAGLYETWRPSPAEKERTLTIITTTPNAPGAGPPPDAGGPRGGGGRRLALRSPDA